MNPVATAGYRYAGGRLCCGGVDLDGIAREVGTPTYVYDLDAIRGRYRAMVGAFSPLCPAGFSIRYAVKANNAPAVLGALAGEGCGMDVVSMGELERAWLSGVPMERISYAGVAKSARGIAAALCGTRSDLNGAADLVGDRDLRGRGSVGLFVVESAEELRTIAGIAEEIGVRARVAIRVNPGVTAGANEKVRVASSGSKFGLVPEDAFRAAVEAAGHPSLVFRGLHMHIGSQIAEVERFDEAAGVMVGLSERLHERGCRVEVLDLGAGAAVSYMGEAAPSDEAFAEAMTARVRGMGRDAPEVWIEPGRELVGQAGVLLTGVRRVKRTSGRTFVVTDAGLNALVRPAMYGARHMVWPVVTDRQLDPIAPLGDASGMGVVDVVGPVCESSDILLRDWAMPEVGEGDTLAVFTAGAYGMGMAMTFNDLPLPAEVVIEGGVSRVVRARGDLVAILRVGTAAAESAAVR